MRNELGSILTYFLVIRRVNATEIYLDLTKQKRLKRAKAHKRTRLKTNPCEDIIQKLYIVDYYIKRSAQLTVVLTCAVRLSCDILFDGWDGYFVLEVHHLPTKIS